MMVMMIKIIFIIIVININFSNFRSSKKKALEKTKINLELILTSDESDFNDEHSSAEGSPDSDEFTF